MKKTLFFSLFVFGINFGFSQTHVFLPNELNSKNSYQENSFYEEGNSEIFIKVFPREKFKISINDQTIENRTGFFRFFNLSEGEKFLSIWKDGILIYQTRLLIHHNTRIIGEFYDDKKVFFLVNKTKINDEELNWTRNHIPYETIHSSDFTQFLEHFKNQSFDKDKIKFLNAHIENLNLTTKQILLLVRNTSFDEGKLSIAKIAYPKCIDKEKYYLVENEFGFGSSVQQLREFIKNFKF